ncbi:MAG TPA: type II secretion system F family protein [Thermoguttaceae bacterium]|nr:type II secretion system F family protein [Thermoguttaceae bacterium]
MPEFNYVARDPSGEKVTGVVTAATRQEAVSALAGRSLFPVDVRGETGAAEAGRVRRVPAQLLATTYGQLADLLRSGVPLLRALEVLRRQTSHAGLKEVLCQVHRGVEEGSTLAQAMNRHRRVFGEMAVSMVRAGGEGGFLEEALSHVASFTETQADFKSRTVGAVTYPCVLAAFGSIVVVVLLVFFVPMFDTLFDRLRERGELPILTEWLLGLSRFIGDYILWVLLGAAVFGAFAWQWLISDRGRTWRDLVKLRMPLAGKIFSNLAVARFCRVLGTLLHNGVPILRSLEISAEAAANRVLAQAIHGATENISAGESLAGPLAACGHFPPTIVEMISVAEESNTLETVLLDIANSLERRTWRQLELAVRLLEPLLLVMLASVVLVLVVALLLPMFKMSMTL